MPEMKLKQQNLIFNFKSTIKNMETKLSFIEKMENTFPNVRSGRKNKDNSLEQKNDIERVNKRYACVFCNAFI